MSPQKKVNLLKRAVFEAMDSYGVTSIDVTYSGSGDSGSVEDVLFYDAHAVSLDFGDFLVDDPTDVRPDVKRRYALADLVRDLVYALLDHEDIDWYNNEGGVGSMTIHIDGKIVIDHQTPVTSWEESQYTHYRNATLDEPEELNG